MNRALAAREAGTKWTCPMHPQIVRDGPGSCPLCGMALEPVMPAAGDVGSPELRDMSRRFWVAAVLSGALMLTSMGQLLPPAMRSYFEVALASPVCVWSAWPFLVRAVESVQRRSLNMFTLIGLGVSVAYVYSVVATVAPGAFPESLRDSSGQ